MTPAMGNKLITAPPAPQHSVEKDLKNAPKNKFDEHE
jgi:hypothetical protein